VKKRSKKKNKKRLKKTGKKPLDQQMPIADAKQEIELNSVMEAEPVLELTEQEMAPVLEGYDETSLARAKTHWFFGEWQQLAALDIGSLSVHPERDRFALLIASANQQLGEHDKARKYTRMSLDWGCPHQVVAQVLIAGVHNTLGRAAALKQDEARISHHFEASVAAIGTKDTALVSHARSVREMARMGLLPQAASIVDKQLKETHDVRKSQHQLEAQYKVLQTEVELLSHELSLAQQRQQFSFETKAGEHGVLEADPNNPAWIEMLKKHSVSQLGQDLWVLEQTNYKRDGFFVEFGATDGVLLSNSWLLEKEFGWQGICAEPNPKFYKKLQRNRDCMVFNECIGAKTGEEVEFVFADAYGGMTKHLGDDAHGEKRAAYLDVGDVTVLHTISLHDFLKRCDAPREIDFLSIDTEGSEFEILESFPFNDWDIRLFAIEHNYTNRRASIKKLMKSKGYRCIEMKWDDWFVKNN